MARTQEQRPSEENKIPIDKRKVDKASNLSITVDMNTDKLQQQLRVITKHLTALADELAKIDDEIEYKPEVSE